MALFINNDNIFVRLQRRLNLKWTQEVPNPLALESKVNLVAEISQDLRTTLIGHSSTAVAAAGLKVCFTVPLGKRWWLRSADFYATGLAAKFKVTGLWIGDGTTTLNITSTTEYTEALVNFAKLEPVNPGWTIQVQVSSYLLPDNLVLNIYYDEEDYN
jgi:hypothetical protein